MEDDLHKVWEKARREFKDRLAIRVGEMDLDNSHEVVAIGNGHYYKPDPDDGCAKEPNVE